MQNPPPKHVMTLMKSDGHKYVFIYEHGHEHDMARVFGRFACRSDLSFNWRDALAMSTRLKADEWDELP